MSAKNNEALAFSASVSPDQRQQATKRFRNRLGVFSLTSVAAITPLNSASGQPLAEPAYPNDSDPEEMGGDDNCFKGCPTEDSTIHEIERDFHLTQSRTPEGDLEWAAYCLRETENSPVILGLPHQKKGGWADLKKAETGLTQSGQFSDVCVQTGPLPHDAGYWKVIATEKGGEIKMAAFILENRELVKAGFKETSVDDIETQTGLNLFPEMSPTQEVRIEALKKGGLSSHVTKKHSNAKKEVRS